MFFVLIVFLVVLALSNVAATAPHSKSMEATVSLLSNGNIVMSGLTRDIFGAVNAYLECLTPGGVSVWRRELATGNNSQTAGSDKDSSDNIYAGFRCNGAYDPTNKRNDNDVCVVKYDSNGNELYFVQVGTNASDIPYGIAVNQADRSVWVAGSTNSAMWDGKAKIGEEDAFLMKISPEGEKTTLFRFGEAQGRTRTIFSGVAVDSKGNLWTTGYAQWLSPRSFIRKISPTGTTLFADSSGDGNIFAIWGKLQFFQSIVISLVD